MGTNALRKKHNIHAKQITYIEGDLTDKIIKEIKEKYGVKTNTELLRAALIYYRLFLEKNFK